MVTWDLPVDRQSDGHASEHSTFPQLRWWAVKSTAFMIILLVGLQSVIGRFQRFKWQEDEQV